MAIRSALSRRLRPSTRTRLSPMGFAIAGVLAAACLFGCPQPAPAGGGGGGGGGRGSVPGTHSDAFSRSVGDAYIGAASVHEALVRGNFAGARKLLDGVMHDLQAARGRARPDEQRQILHLEDRGLQLAGSIDRRSPTGLADSQAFMNAVEKNQLLVPTPPNVGQAKPMSSARTASATAAKVAPKPRGILAAKPRAGGIKKPLAKAGKKPLAKGAKKPLAKASAGPSSVRRTHAVHAAVRPKTSSRVAGAWPVRPHPVRNGPHGAPSDAGLTRVRLATAVVGAIHAEQALLGGRMSVAFGQVKSLRQALKQAHAKGTPWQRRALTRLDKQANQLQVELAHGNPAAFAHAASLVDASLQVQQSFKSAGGGGARGTAIAAKPDGGGGNNHPKAHSKSAAKPGAKPGTKPGAKPGAKAHPPTTKGKPPKGGHPAAPPVRPKPASTPRLPETSPPPADPTMDEDHPGALPAPP